MGRKAGLPYARGVQRVEVSLLARVLHIESAPPQARGSSLEPKWFEVGSGLIGKRQAGYSVGEYHRLAGAPAGNKC